MTSLREETIILRRALNKIAEAHSCGCNPCAGQCESGDALRIWKEEVQSLARDAIRTVTMTVPGSDCGNAFGSSPYHHAQMKAQAQAYMKVEERKMEPKQVEEIVDRALDRYHNKHWYEEPRPSFAPLYLAAAYIAAGFATFAYVQNHAGIEDRADRTFGSIISIPGWPIYWAGQVALAADRAITQALTSPPAAPAKPPSACTDGQTIWPPDAQGVCHYPNPAITTGTITGGGGTNNYVCTITPGGTAQCEYK